MARFSRKIIDDILAHADVVDVISHYITPSKRSGRDNVVFLCPFHDDHHASLQASKSKGIWKCFSCGESGNAITFIQKYKKIPFDEAMRECADIIGYHDYDKQLNASVEAHNEVEAKLAPLYSTISDLQAFYANSLLTEEGKAAFDYLQQRGLGMEQISKFGIGYAPKDGASTLSFLGSKGHSTEDIKGIGIVSGAAWSDRNAGRVIFPLSNIDGKVVGFSARVLSKESHVEKKYMVSFDNDIFHKGEILYNYDRALASSSKARYCYVFEGFMDLIAADQVGITSAIALLGVSIDKRMIPSLKRLGCELRLCLDGDEAGQTGMKNCGALLQKEGIPFRLVQNIGDSRDPDDVLRQDGPEKFKEWLNHLVTPFNFLINYYGQYGLAAGEKKSDLVDKFLPFLASVSDEMEKQDDIEKLAKIVGFEPQTVSRALIRYQTKKREQAEPKNLEEISYVSPKVNGEIIDRLHPEKGPLRRLYLSEKEVLYQMLNHQEAIDFFKKNIETFSDDIFEKIANYLIQYVEEHDQGASVDLNRLAAEIQSSESNGDEIVDQLYKVAGSQIYPPYSEEEMEECSKNIQKEREERYRRSVLEAKLEGKSEEDQKRILNDAAREKAKRLSEANK